MSSYSYSDAGPDAAALADAAAIASLKTVVTGFQNMPSSTPNTAGTPNSYWIAHYQNDVTQNYDDFQVQMMQKQIDYVTNVLHQTGPAQDLAAASPRLQTWIAQVNADKLLP